MARGGFAVQWLRGVDAEISSKVTTSQCFANQPRFLCPRGRGCLSGRRLARRCLGERVFGVHQRANACRNGSFVAATFGRRNVDERWIAGAAGDRSTSLQTVHPSPLHRAALLGLVALLAACSAGQGSGPADAAGGEEDAGDAGAVGASCTNGTKDGDEVGVDCGGSCPQRCDGDPCATDGECKSRVCAGVCLAPGPKGCGVGAAALCASGAVCERDEDCLSLQCSGSICL